MEQMIVQEAETRTKLRCTWVGLRQIWQVRWARGSLKGEGAMDQS
jgi:hypothetical protein